MGQNDVIAGRSRIKNILLFHQTLGRIVLIADKGGGYVGRFTSNVMIVGVRKFAKVEIPRRLEGRWGYKKGRG
jgi:hypothetical protein